MEDEPHERSGDTRKYYYLQSINFFDLANRTKKRSLNTASKQQLSLQAHTQRPIVTRFFSILSRTRTPFCFRDRSRTLANQRVDSLRALVLNSFQRKSPVLPVSDSVSEGSFYFYDSK